MPQTLFEKIIAKTIPAKIVHEDDKYLVIQDITPQAPVHLLIVTKKVIPSLNALEPADSALVGGMFLLAKKLMAEQGHTDYRAVFNCGPTAGQTVPHLHLHLLAGRNFNWPPG